MNVNHHEALDSQSDFCLCDKEVSLSLVQHLQSTDDMTSTRPHRLEHPAV